MNYPWDYTDNGGGETNFWSNFRWEFDDVELIWMRHADRSDVIFGGRDWIGNNLSVDLNPAYTFGGTPASLEVTSPEVFDIGVPVHLELKLENTSDRVIQVVDRLQPEDGLLRVVIERPGGEIVDFKSPVQRLLAPPDPIELAPGDAIRAGIEIAFGAKGPLFAEPGSYLIRLFWPCYPLGFIATELHRIRIAHPLTRQSEELAHLLTSREAAQFLYYGGGRRRPDVREKLIEAAERYADSDPVAVRHIAAALGRDAGRVYKHPVVKDGHRVIAATPADPERAMNLLAAAVAPLPEDRYRETSAFSPMVEADLVSQFADLAVEAGRKKLATDTLEAAVDRLRAHGTEYAVEPLQLQVKNLKRRKT